MTDRKELRGVGGWLGWLVFAMCVLGPLFSWGSFYAKLKQAEDENPSLLKMADWINYTSWATTVEVTTIGCLLIGGILLWQRFNRSSVYAAIAALWLANLGSVIGQREVFFLAFPQFANSNTFSPLNVALFRPILIALIWTLYLLLSRRVKNTYIANKANKSNKSNKANLEDVTAPGLPSTIARPKEQTNMPLDSITQIERLKALLESGALTQVEFDVEKRKVIGI